MDMDRLTHAVECKWPGKPYWQPIAAFDSERVAGRYKAECETGAMDLKYRVSVVRRVLA